MKKHDNRIYDSFMHWHCNLSCAISTASEWTMFQTEEFIWFFAFVVQPCQTCFFNAVHFQYETWHFWLVFDSFFGSDCPVRHPSTCLPMSKPWIRISNEGWGLDFVYFINAWSGVIIDDHYFIAGGKWSIDMLVWPWCIWSDYFHVVFLSIRPKFCSDPAQPGPVEMSAKTISSGK